MSILINPNSINLPQPVGGTLIRGGALNWQNTVLLRASEAGSPTNRSGSDKTRGQGSFGPSTGGPDLQESLQPAELTKAPQDFTVSTSDTARNNI